MYDDSSSKFGYMLLVGTMKIGYALAERVGWERGMWVGTTLRVTVHGDCCSRIDLISIKWAIFLLSCTNGYRNAPFTL